MATDERAEEWDWQDRQTLLSAQVPAEKVPQAVKKARKRAEKRIEEREHLRLEIRGRECIQVCYRVMDTLMAGVELPPPNPIPGVPALEVGTPVDRARVQALKGAADISLRLLDRVLPSLKAVEMTSTSNRDDVAKMSTADLMRMVMDGKMTEGEYEEMPRRRVGRPRKPKPPPAPEGTPPNGSNGSNGSGPSGAPQGSDRPPSLRPGKMPWD